MLLLLFRAVVVALPALALPLAFGCFPSTMVYAYFRLPALGMRIQPTSISTACAYRTFLARSRTLSRSLAFWSYHKSYHRPQMSRLLGMLGKCMHGGDFLGEGRIARSTAMRQDRCRKAGVDLLKQRPEVPLCQRMERKAPPSWSQDPNRHPGESFVPGIYPFVIAQNPPQSPYVKHLQFLQKSHVSDSATSTSDRERGLGTHSLQPLLCCCC